MSSPASKPQQSPSKQAVTSPVFKLNWELAPWLPTIAENVASIFKLEPESPPLSFRPGIFWKDVFVDQRLNWKNIVQSYGYHLVFAGLVYVASMPFYAQRFSVIENFRHDAITYAPEVTEMEAPVEPEVASAKVPQIVSHSSRGPVEMSGDAVLRNTMAKSVPRDADNRTHTIIDPEAPKLTTEAPMPDLVAWTHTPQAPPVAATAQAQPRLIAPIPEVVPVAPPPDVQVTTAKVRMPEVPDVVPPPVEVKIARSLSDVNVPNLQPEAINAEPKLPTQSDQAAKALAGLTAEVAPVAPPPEIKGVGPAYEGSGALISINVAPVRPPETAPRGSARGSFAGAPEGRPTASAEPERHAGGSGPGGESPTRTKEEWGLTAAAPAGPAGGQRSGAISSLLMGMSVPSLPARSAQPAKELADLSPIDQRVFRGRKSYTMALNTPNLTSVGGSWIFRFAERGTTYKPGELIAPVAVREVDPAYPADLIHDKVEGVVILYAIIRADGTVAEVKVLEGFDDRLDENARKALSAWHFVPGTRDGSPVDLEAVVRIPFRAQRVF